MAPFQELLKVLNLRTHPFFPAVDADGKEIPKSAVEQSLDPTADSRALRYYFDVYDWSTGSMFGGGLAPGTGLKAFPRPGDLGDNGLLILISGFGQTGRDSLVNLLLHRLTEDYGVRPLVVDVRLDSRDKARSLREVAGRFVNAFAADRQALPEKPKIVEELRSTLERETKDTGSASEGYSNLFLTIREIFRSASPNRTVVLRVHDGGDHDVWTRIFDAVRPLCSFVVVTASDRYYAKACYGLVSGNRQWIRAEPLDVDRAKEYLRTRVELERVGPGVPEEPLAPFTEEALGALFEPGTASQGAAVTYPVGWLRRTLRRALDDLLEEMRRLPPPAPRIDAKRIRQVREQMNMGR